MTSNSVSDLLHLVEGRWKGEEEILVDPAKGTRIHATASFENSKALNGAGFRASYLQETNGVPGLACETVYRLGEDGNVTMVWFPADGEPLVMKGTRSGATITVSRTDPEGMNHTLVSDYSQMGVVTISMSISHGGSPPFTAFTGRYVRVDSREGGDL